MSANGNGSALVLRWWPIIAFFLVQIVAGAMMYADIRARLVVIESNQKEFVRRSEAEVRWQEADRDRERLRQAIEQATRRGSR